MSNNTYGFPYPTAVVWGNNEIQKIQKIQLQSNFVTFCYILRSYSNASEERQREFNQTIHGFIDKEKFVQYIHESTGNTPLIIACDKGRTDIVRLLLQKGADPNIQNKTGDTALIVTCIKGHTEIVKLLMDDNRTNPNIQNKTGDTALICSIRGRTNRFPNTKLKIVKILLDGLPDKIHLNTFLKPEVGFDNQEIEALKNAKKKRKEAVRGNGNHTRSFRFPNYTEPSSRVKNKRYVPNIEMGGIQLTSKEKFILPNLPDYTLDINIQNKNGYTALMFAVENINLDKLDKEIIELLVTKGANALLKNNNNMDSKNLLSRSIERDYKCLIEDAPLVYRQINYLLNESSIFYSTHNV